MAGNVSSHLRQYMHNCYIYFINKTVEIFAVNLLCGKVIELICFEKAKRGFSLNAVRYLE